MCHISLLDSIDFIYSIYSINEYEFLKNVILHSLLHEMGEGNNMGHGDDDNDMWRFVSIQERTFLNRG